MSISRVAWLLGAVIVVTVVSDPITTAHTGNHRPIGMGQPPGFQLGSGAGEKLRDFDAQKANTTLSLVAGVRVSALGHPSERGLDPGPLYESLRRIVATYYKEERQDPGAETETLHTTASN